MNTINPKTKTVKTNPKAVKLVKLVNPNIQAALIELKIARKILRDNLHPLAVSKIEVNTFRSRLANKINKAVSSNEITFPYGKLRCLQAGKDRKDNIV